MVSLVRKIGSGRGDVAASIERLELTCLMWLAVLEDVVLPHAAATVKSDAQESVAAALLRVDVIDALTSRGRSSSAEAHERRAWCSVVEGELATLSGELRSITRLLAKGDLDALHRSASTLRREIADHFHLL